MKLGFRSKLFLVSLLVIAATLVGGGTYLEHRLVDRLETRIESELLRATRSARQAAELLPDDRPVSYQQLASRLREAAEARVTIVAADGTVLGDSDVPEHLVASMENHADRPEIRAAWAQGQGVSRRFSATLGKQMQYAAVPFDRGGERAIIRSALPLSEVERSVTELRTLLLAAGLLALGISALMSLLSTHYMAATIRQLFSVTRTSSHLAPGTVSASGRGDIENLAGSLGEMAEAFEDNLRTLAWERDRFDAVLQSMGDAVVAVDAQGLITLCNLASLRMLGWDKPPLGRSLVEVLRQPALHDLVESTELAEDAPREVEITLPDESHLLVRSARLASIEGGVLLVMRDVTKLRKLETVRRDFVTNVSHELRTPVTTIRATVEALQGGAANDPQHGPRFLELLGRNAERLSLLIDELLDLSRIEEGKSALTLRVVRLPAVVERAVASVRDAATDKQVDVRDEVPADLQVLADDAALERVVFNLLDNAVKYCPAGSRVTIRAAGEDPGCVRLEVQDDGPGIPARHHQRVFERFYRLVPGRSREVGGTGLGLSIVRHLVEGMNGQVGVEDVRPHGSLFWVRLPRTPSEGVDT